MAVVTLCGACEPSERVIVGKYDERAYERRQAKRAFDEAYESGRTAGHIQCMLDDIARRLKERSR